MEKLSFAVTLGGTGVCNALIYINGELYDDVYISEEETIEFECGCGAENELKIEFAEKKQSDVVLDKDGNILSDQLLHIKKIEIDEIDITNLCRMQAEYTPTDPWYIENHPDSPVLRNHMDLGWNGNWTLQFETPFYIWLLENL